jgi:type I restriction enzyme S subunit
MSEVGHIPQLRFSEFSGEWKEKKLGDVGETFNGLTGKTKEDFGKGKPYIQYTQIFESSKININNFGLVDVRDNENQKTAQYGDVFFTTSSETPEEVGYSSVLLDNIGDLYLNSFCFGFRPSSLNELNPNFAQFLMRSADFRKRVIRLAQGSTRYNMSKVQLMKEFVKLPSLEEQQKIAAFLTAVDNKIEQLGKKKALLGEYKKGLMQQIFSQAIRFTADDTPGQPLLPNGNSPSGSDFPDWEEKSLGGVCSKAKSGGTPRSTTKEYYDGDIPFLAISDITRQGKYLTSASRKISQLGIDNSASWIVPIDTIIYSMYASVGFVSINKIPLATSQAVINLIVKDGYSIEFIYYHLIEIKKTIHKFIETGTQGNLNAQTVKSLILNIPSLPEQTKIASFLSSIDNKIEQVGKQLDESKQFKKALLQQMFV